MHETFDVFRVFFIAFIFHGVLIASASISFDGTVYMGITEALVHQGGGTFRIHTNVPVFMNYDENQLKIVLTSILEKSIGVNMIGTRANESFVNSWSRQLSQLMDLSTVKVLDNGRSAEVIFAAMPQWKMDDEYVIVLPCLPLSIFGVHPFVKRDKAFLDCIAGNPIVLTPKRLLHIDDQAPEEHELGFFVTGKPVSIRVGGDISETMEPQIELLQGELCYSSRSAIVQGSVWDASNRTFKFVPYRGGAFSLCYSPFPNNFPYTSLKMGATLYIAGPEGVSTDPPQIRCKEEFVGTVYGMNLTHYDDLIITDQKCDEFSLDTALLPEMSVSSPTRVIFFAALEHEGTYQACYSRDGSDVYVSLTTLVVLKNDEIIVGGENQNYAIRRETRFLHNSTISRLKVIHMGNLELKDNSINVTTFLWYGGTIKGKGDINCTSVAVITSHVHKSRTLSVILRNYGEMSIDVHQLNLEGHGVIYNYGNLTITLKSLSMDDETSIRSRGRNNAIINYGGRIYINTSGMVQQVVCHARIVNMEGILILSGALSFADLANGEGAHLVLKKNAQISVTEARFRGNITLGVGSVLQLVEDCAFVSVVVGGLGGSIFITGDTALFDTLLMQGNVTMNIFGYPSSPSSISVSVYGTNRLFPGTRLNVHHARFVTGTGLANLFIDGSLAVDYDTVSISNSSVMRLGGTTIIYSSMHKSVFLQKEYSMSIIELQRGAVLMVINTDLEQLKRTACQVTFTFPRFVSMTGCALVHGCISFPFGGIIGGRVGRLENKNDCPVTSAILGHKGMSESLVFLQHPDRMPELILESLTFCDEVSRLNGSQVIIDNIAFHNASVFCGNNSVTKDDKRVAIDNASLFPLHHQDIIFTSKALLKGLREMSNAEPPQIHAVHEISGNATVQLLFMPWVSCNFSTEVDSTIMPDRSAIGECYDSQHDESIQSVPLATRSGREEHMLRTLLVTPLHVDGPEALFREKTQRHFLLHNCFDYAYYSIPTDIMPVKKMVMLTIMFFAVAFAVFYTLLYSWRFTLRSWLKDIGCPPPLQLTLRWWHLTTKAVNGFMLLAVIFNTVQITFASFHPQLPFPVGFVSDMSIHSTQLTVPHQWFQSIIYVRFLFVIAIVLGILGPPVSFFCRCSSVILLEKKGKFFLFLSVFKQFYHGFQLVYCMFFVPFLSLTFDLLACNTFLSDVPTCKVYHGSYLISISAFATLVFLIPRSTLLYICRPLWCDLNIKLSCTFAVCTLMMLQVTMWKILYARPVGLVLCNTIFQILRTIYYSYAWSTVYGNMNRFFLQITVISLVINLFILFHVVRVKMGFTKSVRDGELYFTFIFIGALLTTMLSLWFNLFSIKTDECSTGDSIIDALYRSIEQIRSRILDLKYELLMYGTLAERESLINVTSQLRVELLEKQESHRLLICRHLATFFYPNPEDDSSVDSDLTFASLISQNANVFICDILNSLYSSDCNALTENNQLHLAEEDFESFCCGPALGSGSYGAVHLGILRCGKLIAVKYINTENITNSALTRVQTEVNMMSAFSHPNIIRYYGCHTKNGCMMIFMEFAVAGSLISMVKKFAGLSEEVIQMYTFQILCGLRYLHEKGIVHRDIKGENILVDGFGVVKLADFGCSKELAGNSSRSHAGCKSLVGSPFWMAPEVIRNEAYGTKADIWSVGCTVVELLNGGDPPWHEEFDNMYSAMYHVGSTDNIPVIREDASELCRDFLNLCFQRDVEKRPSADALLKHEWLSKMYKMVNFPSLAKNVRIL